VSVKGFPPDGLPPGETVRSQAGADLQPVPHQVVTSRDFVRGHLPEMSDTQRDDILLMTSELVTNAVIHARTVLNVGVTVGERSVVVSVYDLNVRQRQPAEPAPRDGGRGFVLVRGLAHAWSVHHPSGGGKTVWFRMDLGGPAAGESEDAR
jgi:anti-sigma regulatory factor (Ser/Thr protein kinase)